MFQLQPEGAFMIYLHSNGSLFFLF